MSHRRLFALAACLALPLASRAQSLTNVSVSASMRFPMFATTTPVLETIRFDAATAETVHDGWSDAVNTTLLTSSANVAHVVTIVAISGCGEGDDSDANPATVQWSSDDGDNWHDLAFEPAPIGPRETPGDHAAERAVRYRRRVTAGASGCTMQAAFTALPAQ